MMDRSEGVAEKFLFVNPPFRCILPSYIWKKFRMKTKRHVSVAWGLAALALVVILLSGCSNRESVEGCVKGTQYGFWSGLWHGIIAPVQLVFMIWRDDVAVFATNNTGAWYSFGFLIGSGGWGFLGGKGSKKR